MSPIDMKQLNGQRALLVVLEGRKHQHSLCDDLEALADRLGEGVDHHLAAKCRRYLDRDLTVHQRDEEAVYRILKTSQPTLSVSRQIGLAEAEHQRQREYALEVNECLGDVTEGRRQVNPEALGYLLRATFESIRQHLAWEEATLFQDARLSIVGSSDSDLARHLAINRGGQASRLRIID